MNNDLISRKAVINEMKDMYTAAEEWAQEAHDDDTRARAESCMATNVELKLRVEKLPSAQPEHLVKESGNLVNGLVNDCISRQAAIDALEIEKTYSAVYKYGYTQTDYFKQYNTGLTDGIKALNKLPSAQPEIIRCKDCKYWMRAYLSISGKHGCNVMRDYTAPDDYCFKAERKA